MHPRSSSPAEDRKKELLISGRVSLGTSKPTECDRCDSEKRCDQIVTKKPFVTREISSKPCKAVCAAKGGEAPLPISLAGKFLLQNAVCPFANWLRRQHKLSQGATVHVRNQRIRGHFYRNERGRVSRSRDIGRDHAWANVKANANGATFRVCDKARGAPIKNDVLQEVWFALRCDATPLCNMVNTPCRRELLRAVSLQSVRRLGEKIQKIQIAKSLSNDNASFGGAAYDGARGKEKNQ